MAILPGTLSCRATPVFFPSCIYQASCHQEMLFSVREYRRSSSSISDLHLHLFYFHITVQITSSGSSDFLLLSPILTVWHHTVHNCCTYLSCNFFHLLVIFFNVYLLLPGLNSKFENPHLYSPLYFPVLGAQWLAQTVPLINICWMNEWRRVFKKINMYRSSSVGKCITTKIYFHWMGNL